MMFKRLTEIVAISIDPNTKMFVPVAIFRNLALVLSENESTAFASLCLVSQVDGFKLNDRAGATVFEMLVAWWPRWRGLRNLDAARPVADSHADFIQISTSTTGRCRFNAIIKLALANYFRLLCAGLGKFLYYVFRLQSIIIGSILIG